MLYLGTGEAQQRPDLSVGHGVYKSTDAGRTWMHLPQLRDTQQIGALVVHPTNPGRLFVAALGHPYGPNAERGVFRSADGGASFERVLFTDENTGAVDIAMDPNNPDILYAALWQARQGPWENGDFPGQAAQLFGLVENADLAPTPQMLAAWQETASAIDDAIAAWERGAR